MAEHRPPPRTREPLEDRKIQRFLQLAAPIVLEGPDLDEDRWRRLSALAEELELSPEQLRQTIQDLCRRGVLRKADVPVPKPPPLPSAGPAAQVARRAELAGPLPSPPDSDFSLSPPPSRASRPPAERPAVPQAAPVDRFREAAAGILARHRGGGPRAQLELAAAAQEFGLSRQEADEALRQLFPERPSTPAVLADRESEPAPKDEPASTPLSDRRNRWRSEEATEPAPPPPVKEPAETFREVVRLALEQNRQRPLTAEHQQGLIQHGVTVLGLAPLYARHLINAVAAESSLEPPGKRAHAESVSAGEKADPRLRSFIDAAAPILAQHRGVNAQSRVLLNAVARARGLTDEDLEQALALLQTRQGPSEEDLENERLEAFRQYLRSYLARSPQAIVTPNVEQTLTEQGRMLYGIRPDRVRAAIRESARERNMAVISRERAEQHIRQLLGDLMGDALRLNRDLRDRVEAEGRQWGLSETAIEVLIREFSQNRLQQHKWDRKVTNAALGAASVAVMLVIGFLSWTILAGRAEPTRRGENGGSQATSGPPKVPPRNDRDNAWWDARLSVAIANARVEMPQLLGPLKELDATAPQARAAAYKELAQYLLERSADHLQRGVLEDLLARCYALEPADENADLIATTLLAPVPGNTSTLQDDAAVYPRLFAALRAAANGLACAVEDPQRATRMAEKLSHAVGIPVDTKAPARSLQRQCLGALSERLYRLLIAMAPSEPQRATQLFAAISAETLLYLDESVLDRLNADFLVALLSKTANLWRDYEHLIRKTIESPDPLPVVKLLQLFEQTGDPELQVFMSGPLLRRAGSLPQSNTVSAIAAEVRRSLGVSREAAAGDRWSWLSQSAQEALAGLASVADPDERTLRETLALAHYATLACALTRQEAGVAVFDDLRTKGIPDFAAGVPRSASSEISGRERVSGSPTVVKNGIDRLSRPNRGDRVKALESLAGMAPGIPDLPPKEAERLAAYLLSRKNAAEHARMTQLLPSLRRWPHLRLALADLLETGQSLQWDQREQLQELFSRVLDAPVSISGGQAGRDAVRIQLLQSVLGDLNSAAGGRVEAYGSYDAAATALAQNYRLQAELLGVSASDAAASDRPGQWLNALIRQQAAQWATADDAAGKRRAEELGPRLTAIEYLAADDLQHTVLLEREWLALVSAAVIQKHPDRKEPAEAVVKELQTADRQSTNVLAQLRDGQAALLKLWLLWNQPA